MKNKGNVLLILIFCIMIAAPGVIGLLLPDRVFSESENRNLAEAPKVTAEGFFSGDFMKKFESYVTDQFVLRDSWVAVKAGSELALGRKANNGVELAKGRLIKYVAEPEKADFDKKLSAVDKFAKGCDVPVSFALIPSAACIYKETLTKGAPTADEEEWINYAYDSLGVEKIDLVSTLKEHKDEYIYYRNDHHYTSLGAGYVAAGIFGTLEPGFDFDLNSYEPETVSDSFYGTGRNSFGAKKAEADSIIRYTGGAGVEVFVNEKGELVPGKMYHEEALLHSNQYPYFLGGNTPLCVLTSKAEGGKVLLVRDSFADELAPFLAEYYSEVHLWDLRYNKDDLNNYIKEKDIEKVLIIYSFSDFVTDSKIGLLGR